MRVSDSIRLHYPQYWGFETYPADRACAVSRIAAEWGVFSNFARTPLVVDGVPFDTSERVFQTMKFTDPEARRAVYGKKGNPKMTAKHWQKEGFLRPDWAEHDVDAMKFCLMEKYRQSEAFREELARSQGLYIVEDQTTFQKKSPNTWGVKPSEDGKAFVGPNLMGRLLMELRDNGKLDYTLPEDALSFQDLAD